MNTSDKIKPDWAGGDFLSQFVNLLIQTKPIFSVMKYQARRVLIKTAEKKGIPWRETYQQLEGSDVKALLPEITDTTVVYPDYYQVPFHAYDDGNLCWKAAFEAESATYSMALRVWPKEDLSWLTAQERLRHSFHQVLENYSPNPVRDILDIGCSVGISTQALHNYYQHRQETSIRTVGLDLSPYMLSVAKMRDTEGKISEWKHANAENTGFADDSFDVVTLQFLIHELPRTATRNIFKEALRILRSHGVLAIVDNNPKSAVIQNLPPVLFTLMKSTEPWTDDYYTFDVETALSESGFNYQTTVETDPRHRTIIAMKP
ncbi:MAG: class I SAM-dependent methyltransferase [Arthrospira sp. PLM2.Bin9]|nr:class I SAM-dependent methyltransferase [Arthrospira sp. PLM2.Bin9]TVU53487.1 MAG: class I SAM-dependent methyltransferase [Arthrospira sp. PLM2.Bin9]